MKTSRLEAFSDAVLAIIITIMVLELEAPEGLSLLALKSKIPVFISYLLSFIYVGIFWNNHHHLFQIAGKVNGKVLWANLYLLFWLSLIPFTSSWVGEHHLTPVPVALYGFTLLMSAVAFCILRISVNRLEYGDSTLKTSLGSGNKEKLSLVIYVVGLSLCYLSPLAAMACYVIVALIWIIPDKQIEKSFA